MNKIKTRKATAKRFRVTASGKVMFGHQLNRHKKRKMSGSNMRAKEIPGEMKGKFAKKIRSMIQA